jgi:hypothetical protein
VENMTLFNENNNSVDKPSDLVKHKDNLLAQQALNAKILFHGNKNKNMIPSATYVNDDNDFGSGFYTTPDYKAACEWAFSDYSKGENGFVHSYEIDYGELHGIDFTKEFTEVWVATIIKHRFKLDKDVSAIVKERTSNFTNRFAVDMKQYDFAIAYRADDNFYRYIADFVSADTSMECIKEAVHLGHLGIQVFFRGDKAIKMLNTGKHTCDFVDKKYKGLYKKTQEAANKQYEILRDTKRPVNTMIYNYE